MAYHQTKQQSEQALRAAPRRLLSGRPTTLPLCHDWIGVIGLSPYFFPINIDMRDEPKKGGEYREKEDREDRKIETRKERKQSRKEKNRHRLPSTLPPRETP
jgi:hypothetical protein